jgi:GNAT superfamily N-acetyltransferase
MRFGMYGKDVAQERMEFVTYRLRIQREDFMSTYSSGPFNNILKSNGPWSVNFIDCPTNEYFLYLYNKVGKDYQWYMLNLVDPNSLRKYLDHTFMTTLHMNGEPVGFGSFEVGKNDKDVNITYFGLAACAIGRGVGRHFLKHVVYTTFDTCSTKDSAWLYTTDRDHPNALPSYKSVGFQIEHVGIEHHWAPLSVFRPDEV